MDGYRSLPIARRTRAREEEYLRQLHEKLKAEKKRTKTDNDLGGDDSLRGCETSAGRDCLNQNGAEEVTAIDLDGSDSDQACIVVGENWNLGDNMEGKEFICLDHDDEEEEKEDHRGSEVAESSGLGSGFSKSKSKDSKSNHCSAAAAVGNRTASVDEESSGVGKSADLQRPQLFQKSVDRNGSGHADDAIVLDSSEELESSSEEESVADGNESDDYDAEKSESLDYDNDATADDEEKVEVLEAKEIPWRKSGDKRRSGDANRKVNKEQRGRIDWVVEERGMQKRHGNFDKHNVRGRTSNLVLHSKRKRASSFKEEEAMKILVDSLQSRPTLASNFTYGVENPLPPEKTEEEKENEPLWKEMDLCLCADAARDEGSAASETITSVDSELDVQTRCAQGKHELTLDEEIGFLCKYCSHIDVEIRHYVAPFHTNPRARSERRESHDEKSDFFGNIDYEYFACESKDSDPYFHAEKTVWDLIPEIRKGLHPHQREGLEFLWKNIEGNIDLDELKEPINSIRDSGCIISHAPGTGKTRLAIVFICSYMKLFPTCRPLIIAPCSMLFSWQAEFRKWGLDIPFHVLNHPDLSGKENPQALKILDGFRPEQQTSDIIRLVKLLSWKNEQSVLIISYQLFEKLVGEEKKRIRNEMRKILLELPGLLVLDEGHTPRNDNSRIYDALSRVRTEKRIILSGTPFQNNLNELYNILILARPKFADLISSKHCRSLSKRRRIGKAKGTWASLTDPIGKAADYRLEEERLEEVRAIMKPFVHVHKGTILQERLPGLRDTVILLQPDDMQEDLINKLERMRLNNLKREHLLSSVCVHPSLLEKLPELEGWDIDWNKLERIRLNTEVGIKIKFIMELIRLCEAIKERVLVFSQYITPLNLIVEHLQHRFGWFPDKEFVYFHGKLNLKDRECLMKKFNSEKSEVKVMLASTRASHEGISLVGASRVVLLDVLWNPSVRSQAISRAYRLGQEKVVYAYHLISAGTLEEEKYGKQARKEQLSELVFYSADEPLKNQEMSSKFSEDKKDKVLEELLQREKLKGAFKEIIYEPKDSYCS